MDIRVDFCLSRRRAGKAGRAVYQSAARWHNSQSSNASVPYMLAAPNTKVTQVNFT